MLKQIFVIVAFACTLAFAEDFEWADSPILTRLWQEISAQRIEGLIDILFQVKDAGHHRSADGRGPVFWAYEFANADALAALMNVQATEDGMTDSGGQAPQEFYPGSASERNDFVTKARSRIPIVRQQMEKRLKDLQAQQQQQQYEAPDEDEPTAEEEPHVFVPNSLEPSDEESSRDEVEERKLKQARDEKLAALKNKKSKIDL
eukprot:c15158_g1_i1.p1 GENE.c15158_g1_i1~~c15158_g1_i1.p1  ORF type:complete len:204 (-),score=49.47 c15158_g1_i1:108-719(-)